MFKSLLVKKIIFLIITIKTISSSIIHLIKEKEEHFINVYSEKYIIALFYNKNSCEDVDFLNEIINNLIKNDYIKEKSILIEKIDYGNISFFENHYELEKKTHFELFIRNKRNIFNDFDILFKERNLEKILNGITNFLKDKIERVAIEINNLSDLLRLIKKNKLIGLYLGEKNYNYDKFINLAQQHHDFKFFFNFNKKTKKKIFYFLSEKKFSEKDVFLILRDNSLLNDFDEEEIIKYEFKKKSGLDLEFFFEMEKNPKLRLENHKENIKKIFSKKNVAMVFLISSKTNKENINIFKKSIKKLPKKFIFTYVSIEKDEAIGYIQLFLMNGISYEQDSLYLIYSLSRNKLQIDKMTDSFNEKNIVKFANTFLDHGLK